MRRFHEKESQRRNSLYTILNPKHALITIVHIAFRNPEKITRLNTENMIEIRYTRDVRGRLRDEARRRAKRRSSAAHA